MKVANYIGRTLGRGVACLARPLKRTWEGFVEGIETGFEKAPSKEAEQNSEDLGEERPGGRP